MDGEAQSSSLELQHGSGSSSSSEEQQASEQLIGLVLAVSSSLFIGASFIIKKRGLRLAGSTGLRAGQGGFSYLVEPTWWAGLLAMIVGEAANFAAYAFAPAILVTPLGALSIIISAILAHVMLNERLNVFGMLGCVLCITGSLTIVLHAPPERAIGSVVEVWQLAMAPAFLGYTVFAVTFICFLAWVVAPVHGTSNIFVFLAICSLAGSLSVMSCKALGIAIKLTFQGDNQLVHIETYFCVAVVVCCVLTQMNYLNKALDLFNTAIVSPVYYVMFTTLTILASLIMFKDVQSVVQIATELCGFLTIVSGTFLLHATKDLEVASIQDVYRLNPKSLNLSQLSPNGGGPGGGMGGGGGLGGGSSSAQEGILLGSMDRGKETAARERSAPLLGLMGERMGGDGGPGYHAVAVGEDGSGGKGGGMMGAGSRTGGGNTGGGSWFK